MNGVGHLGVAAFDTVDGEGVLFAHHVVGTTLAVDGEIATSQLVEALVAVDVGALESGGRGARKASDLNFVWARSAAALTGLLQASSM